MMEQRDGGRAFGLVFLVVAGFLFLKRFASAEPAPGDIVDPGVPGPIVPSGQLGEVTVAQHHTEKFPGEPITVFFTWTASTTSFLNQVVPWNYRIRVLFGHTTVLGWKKSGRLGFAEDGDREFVFFNRPNGVYSIDTAGGNLPFIAPDDPGQSWDVHVHLEAEKSDQLGNPIPNDWTEIDQRDHNGAVTTVAGTGAASVGGSLGSIAVARKRRLGRVRR